jgi:DNA polymerase-3 subunit epsilon
MKTFDYRFAVVWIGCVSIGAVACAAFGLGVYAALDPGQKSAVRSLLEAAEPLPYVVGIGFAVLCGFLAAWIREAYFQPLRRATRAVEILANANSDHRIPLDGPVELQGLLAAANGLGERLRVLSSDSESRIRQARSDLELERNRLAVLMSELPQGVIVCDAVGRIQLYNERARRLVGARGEVVDGPAAYMGLGRSLYALISRAGIEGALQRLADRLHCGELDAVETVTTILASGRMARMRVASLPALHGASDDRSGFVLLVDDVTAETTSVERRRVVLSTLLTQAGAALALLRPSVGRLQQQPRDAASDAVDATVEACQRLGIALDAARIEQSVLDQAAHSETAVIGAADLATMAADAIQRAGVMISPETPSGLTSQSVRTLDFLQTLRYLGVRLREEFDIREMTLRLHDEAGHRIVAVGWLGRRLSGATLAAWMDDPLSVGGEPSSMTLRELLQRQSAELVHDIDRSTGRSSLRLSLPFASFTGSSGPERIQSRPVFYDFDLPSLSPSEARLSEAPLTSLVYTAFDTETTGLDPAGGDEIIAIGAVRILNGRILDSEIFDQLIDTTRRIDPEALKIHGIGPEVLRGQPTIDLVLPRFHGFCDETVLLGHNVAFDLRFFQIKEDRIGIRFRQPVLDTLLLAGVLHDDLGDNRLEAIAHRLGIEVTGRHTALGDARVTADVYLKMVPLLAARGIRTLGDAQRASEQTRYARLAY